MMTNQLSKAAVGQDTAVPTDARLDILLSNHQTGALIMILVMMQPFSHC